jgi:hypothetical protein
MTPPVSASAFPPSLRRFRESAGPTPLQSGAPLGQRLLDLRPEFCEAISSTKKAQQRHLLWAAKPTPRSKWNGGYSRTPVLPKANHVGPVSAHLRRPRPRSAMSALRRLRPSPSALIADIPLRRGERVKSDPERLRGWSYELAVCNRLRT